MLNSPRCALVSGVRAVETITASRMVNLLLNFSVYDTSKYLSFPRKRESMLSYRTRGVWIPACAGMTI
jgi:hypothetical protein